MENIIFSYSDMHCEDIIAKLNPSISLEKHILECIRIFKRFKKHRELDAKQLSGKADITENRLLEGAFYCIAYHDHGKATEPFQSKIRGEKNIYCSHSLDSFHLLSHRSRIIHFMVQFQSYNWKHLSLQAITLDCIQINSQTGKVKCHQNTVKVI